MELFSRIVVPLDGSEAAERALPVAEAIALTTGASITLVTVAVQDDHIATAEAVLRRGAFHFDRPVECEVLVGNPVSKMLRSYEAAVDGTVFVMSTHARTAVGTLLLGTVADDMVRQSSAPVVLVGPHVDLPRRGARYEDVIVCLDGDQSAERVFPVVARLERAGMHPWLFEVITDASSAAMGEDVLESNYLHRAADVLRREGVEADWDVGHDHDRSRAIVSFASVRTAPIVALVTRGRDALKRLTAASVTVTVARSASCPVLVVGPAFAGVAAAVP